MNFKLLPSNPKPANVAVVGADPQTGLVKFGDGMAPGDPFWASRSVTAFKARTGSLNRYEAAIPGNPRRSFIPAFVRDARFDADSYSRWEITRKIRYFERNTWIVPAQKSTYVKYTVGANGIQIVPSSSNGEFNKHAAEAYAKWCEEPFLDSTLNMAQGDRLMAGSDFIDGEVFLLKTFAKEAGRKSEPRLQLLESHRCSSPGMEYGPYGVGLDDEQKHLIDGVQLNPIGKPISYWLRDAFSGDGWSPKSTADVIHVFNPERIGMYRGMSGYAAILNILHDLDDLTMLEMDRAKDNSAVAKIFESWNGEMNPEDVRRVASSFGNAPTDQNAETGEDFQKRVAQYRTVLGSRMISLKPGEKMTQLDNANPSAATQWYWRFLISQLCAARDLPLLLILPESIQGTVARGVLDDANVAFMLHFCRYAAVARERYRFFMQWARYNVPTLYDAPADWDRCHVIPPRACNVDAGRNSAADLLDINAGVKSYDDIASRDGTTAEARFRKKAINVAQAKIAAAEISLQYGVEVKPEEVIGNIAEMAALMNKAGVGANEDDIAPGKQQTTEEVEA